MAAIDMHTHAFPDDLAKRALKALEALEEGGRWKSLTDGTIKSLIASMDAADIDVSVVCTIATKPGQAKGILKWCKHIRSDRIEPFPSVHPDDRNPGRLLEKIAREDFVGIKLHPLYQDFDVDDERLDEIYTAAADLGLICLFHSGRDIAFDPADMKASPQRMARVAERFPELTMICAHMGGWRMWDEVEQYLIGSNVHLECSFSLNELDADRAAEMIRRHGPHRVMFGSDHPWASQAEGIKLVEKLPLSGKQKAGILWRNAARLLGYDSIFA